ncbi:MAG: hypothetical protein AAFX10_06495 [Pseudomonadota bacterium]
MKNAHPFRALNLRSTRAAAAATLIATLVLASCATTPPSCSSPTSRNLDSAMTQARDNLAAGCEAHFDRYYDELLTIAEGDPKAENKRAFSEYLLWASDEGILSRRQAEDYYNRFFNVKFMSMRGDYNNCSHTCPNKRRVLNLVEDELSDKERGLLRVSLDNDSYYRADKLYQQLELVLEATCTACTASR